MFDTKRRTGRTTRMLQYAMQLSELGRAVYIIAANEKQAKDLRLQLGNEPHGIKVETESSLGDFDWQRLTVPGAHPYCVFLVDHYAIERKFGALLNMLTNFDNPPMKEEATTLENNIKRLTGLK